LETLLGFDWDAANVCHILRHAVTPFEVEGVAGRPHVIIAAATVKGENDGSSWDNRRQALFGRGLHHPRKAVPNRDRL
jgi:hypothetical protein